MFALAAGYYQNYLKPPEVSILLIGIDGAGKTALLERLKVTDFANIMTNSVSSSSFPGDHNSVNKNHPKSTAALSNTNGSLSSSLSSNFPPAEIKHPKVTTSASNDSNDNNSINSGKSPSSRRRRFMCPAPQSYRKKQLEGDQDEEEIFLPTNNNNNQNQNDQRNGNSYSNKNENHDVLHDVGIENCSIGDEEEEEEDSTATEQQQQQNHNDGQNGVSTSISQPCSIASKKDNVMKLQDTNVEYDLKKGKTMLPLHLVRPTIGMNLAKLEGYGARIRAMDLGGASSMRRLWERYYADIHGLIFVIDISPNATISKLMEARAFYRCMRDDESLANVPILIFGNKLDEQHEQHEQQQYQNEQEEQHQRQQEGIQHERYDSSNRLNKQGEFDEVDLNQDNMTENTSIVSDDDCGSSEQSYSESQNQQQASGKLGNKSLLEIRELFLSPPRGSSTNNTSSSENGDNGNEDLMSQDTTAFFTGSAKTGEGVKIAFQWLIEMSKVFQKEYRPTPPATK